MLALDVQNMFPRQGEGALGQGHSYWARTLQCTYHLISINSLPWSVRPKWSRAALLLQLQPLALSVG